jgi:DNA-binding GntR family transcriptional regulator
MIMDETYNQARTIRQHDAGATEEAQLRAFVEAALPVARERAKQLDEIRDALAAGDHRAALALMRRYVNLPPLQSAA